MIDSTLGEGGHSYAFLESFPQLRILGLDADAAIQAKARQRLSVFGNRMDFHLGWFNDFYSNYPENREKPDIILFDEPTSALDPEMVGDVLELIKKVADTGMTMIVVSHEMNFVKKCSSRVLFIDNGKIALDGTPKEVFSNKDNERLREFLNKTNN